MSIIILPRRFKSQPQYSLQPAPEYADAVILSPFQTGGRNIANSNHISPIVAAGATPVIRDHGRAMNFSGTSWYRTDQTINPVGKKFTIFAWVRPSIVHESYYRFLSTGYSGGIYLGSSNVAGKYMFTVNNSPLDAIVGGQQVIGKRDFVLGVFDGSNAILYVNGREVSRGTASAATTTQYLGVGADHDGSDNWAGDVDTIGLFYRPFSAGEVLRVYERPDRLYKQQQRRLRAIPAVVTEHNLTGGNSTQANAGSTAGIAQTHTLSVQTSAQDASVSTAAITQAHVLSGGNSAQANAASNSAVIQVHALSAGTSTQANAGSTGAVTLGVVHDLTASTTSQANTGAAGAISQAHVLVCPASVQDSIAAASAVVQAHLLIAASSAQANAGSTGAITQHDNTVAGPAGAGPRLRIPHGHRPAMRNTSRPRQLR